MVLCPYNHTNYLVIGQLTPLQINIYIFYVQFVSRQKKSKKQDTEVMVRKSAEKQESEGESPVGEDPEDKERKATAAMEAERIKIELDKENERTGNCNVM